jgi:hypothetical protein
MLKIRPEMAQHPLAIAAREVNSYAETHGLEETCEYYDLKQEDVHYIAEQRALRALFAFKGINLNPTHAMVMSLSSAEIAQQIRLAAAYMDGLVIGWRAREIQYENEAAEDSERNRPTGQA